MEEALNEPRQLCSIRAACALAGVTRRTIYNWLEGHKVEYVRNAGGSVRIYVDTLLLPATWPDKPISAWPKSPA